MTPSDIVLETGQRLWRGMLTWILSIRCGRF